MTFHDIDGKDAWRRRVLHVRKQQTIDDRDRASWRIADHIGKVARPGQAVAAYVPMDSEPGSVAMLDALVDAGVQVLLPFTVVNSPLSWALYTGPADLSPAAFGLREPTGPDLGPGGLARADAIIVPALAVDCRGVRLGRGAGYYDRSLAMVDGDVPLIAVVNDAELVDALPDEPHDIRMTHALTPSGGLQALVPAEFVGSRT
ncbi:5-formyltetrahydrofolate cyclo-ligase [Rhodococcus koreensis]|uniref:5-formyltetrahydrofolate cyclo-ligase n=1 Tax=Rhodococcus koreensis TaxID=99653 RepID=A0A1H4WPR2_9NOCA|nr:5-formyltetrahydrofolate cyclo-ligase [Rhodococcus koreensis]SEC94601.1 5-formyltetrahydrofolate cyclo-ligase [Rhodococcus koreensis]